MKSGWGWIFLAIITLAVIGFQGHAIMHLVHP